MGIGASAAVIIVSLDVIETGGVGDTGDLIRLTKIVGEVGIILDALPITFEMAMTDRIESDQGREQALIRLAQSFPRQIAVFVQARP